MAFEVDSRPTADGHDWFCNRCEFQCQPLEAAIDHVIEHKAGPHYCYERSRPPVDGVVPKGARRRIIVTAEGLIVPQSRPEKRT